MIIAFFDNSLPNNNAALRTENTGQYSIKRLDLNVSTRNSILTRSALNWCVVIFFFNARVIILATRRINAGTEFFTNAHEE